MHTRGMKAGGKNNTEYWASTDSVGRFLHWSTHYVQSPVAAVSGYLEMSAQTKTILATKDMVTQAQLGVEQVRHILSGVVLTHTYLQHSPLERSASELRSCLVSTSIMSGLDYKVHRKEALPSVIVQQELFCASLGLMCADILRRLGGQRLNLRFRQRGDEMIVHIAFPRHNRDLTGLLQYLVSLPIGNFSLAPGEYLPLVAAVSILRQAGAHIVLRPRSLGRIDLYLHLQIARQLRLEDMNIGAAGEIRSSRFDLTRNLG